MNRLASYSSTDNKSLALAAVILTGFLLVLPGCCIPKLPGAERGAPLPEDFNGAATADNSAQVGWREFFNDPTLSSMIDQALVGNQELKILTQRVRMANYEIMGRSGAYLPFVSLRSRAGIEKPSLFTPLGTVENQLQPVPGVGFPDPLPDFLMAADISWEVDIWRKLRNARDAASLRFLGTRDGQNYIVTRMVAEVSQDYYELMALDNRMLALDRTIQIQEQSLEMAKAKKAAGHETELAVQRFQAEVRKNQSQKLIIQQQIVEVENKINFTLGRYPQPVARDSSKFLDLTLHTLSVGVPSQLLRNRSDIRQAERELAAAGLDVRVARARFYPSLNLTGAVGYEAFNTRYLFTSPESLIYGAAGELVAPLINRRAIKADYLTANAMQLEKIYDYQRTVLNAFTEVINRLAKVENYGRSIEIKKEQLAALEASVDNATKLFQAAHVGIEYMDVLLAQRDLMEAKMVLIETKQEQLAAIVNAYQALGGGGWVPNGGQSTGVFVDGVCYPAPAAESVPLGQPVPPPEEAEPLPPPVSPLAPPAAPITAPTPGAPPASLTEPPTPPVAPSPEVPVSTAPVPSPLPLTPPPAAEQPPLVAPPAQTPSPTSAGPAVQESKSDEIPSSDIDGAPAKVSPTTSDE